MGRDDDHRPPADHRPQQGRHVVQTEVIPPVGLMDLPRRMGDFPDQEEEVFPHLPGQAVAGGGREFRQGVGEVLLDHPAPQPNHVVEQPCESAGDGPAALDPHRLHDADQDAHQHVSQVIHHVRGPPWPAAIFAGTALRAKSEKKAEGEIRRRAKKAEGGGGRGKESGSVSFPLPPSAFRPISPSPFRPPPSAFFTAGPSRRDSRGGSGRCGRGRARRRGPPRTCGPPR